MMKAAKSYMKSLLKGAKEVHENFINNFFKKKFLVWGKRAISGLKFARLELGIHSNIP